MKKLLIAFILLFSLVAPTFVQAESASVLLMVNNKKVEISPFTSNGNIYVPLDEVAKQMGDEVTSSSYQKKVHIKGETGFLVVIQDGQTTGIVNGKLYPLKTKMVDGEQVNANVKAIYKNGQVYVPIEFLSSGNGMTYPVEVVKENTKTIIYVGKLPGSLQQSISNTPIVLKVNNKQVNSKYNPFISNGTTYVPLNEIAKQMGGRPISRSKEVTVELDGLTFATVTDGESKAEIYDSQLMSRERTHFVPLKTEKVNGNTKDVDAKALYKNGQVYVPVEFISSENGLNYYVETVNEKSKTTIYVGELPVELAETVKKTGYATKWALVSPAPGSITDVTALVKNQQVYIARAQGNWYKIKVGNQSGFVKKDALKIGKSPATGKMYDDGWFASTLKSKWSKDPQVNKKTLENELGFDKGGITYSIFGKSKVIQVIDQGPTASYEVGISFYGWQSSALQ
ncbi:stalk domain-containing protein [Lysinibacillus telephonicus]|uniref:stalk domain-containing protein n=1 Tax=Lysinibacillus telephonicus TaxID=1714840 RepID=UPI0031FDFE2C